MDTYEIATTIIIFGLAGLVYLLNKKRHENEMEIYRLTTRLKQKGG